MELLQIIAHQCVSGWRAAGWLYVCLSSGRVWGEARQGWKKGTVRTTCLLIGASHRHPKLSLCVGTVLLCNFSVSRLLSISLPLATSATALTRQCKFTRWALPLLVLLLLIIHSLCVCASSSRFYTLADSLSSCLRMDKDSLSVSLPVCLWMIYCSTATACATTTVCSLSCKIRL